MPGIFSWWKNIADTDWRWIRCRGGFTADAGDGFAENKYLENPGVTLFLNTDQTVTIWDSLITPSPSRGDLWEFAKYCFAPQISKPHASGAVEWAGWG
jgi:hypothetical protein